MRRRPISPAHSRCGRRCHTEPVAVAAHRRLFYGWWIVFAFVVLNVYWAGTLIYGLTVFFTPVRESFGWSAALLAFIFSLTGILTGLVAPFVGAWFDRSGPRALMLVATACSGFGLLALSRTTSLASFIAAFTLVSIGFGIWASGTGVAAAGLWFARRRGLAMGIVLAGVSLGGVLVPVWKLVVDHAGWRTAFVIAGGALLVISVPTCLLLRRRPEDLGLLPDGDRGVAAFPARARAEQRSAMAQNAVPGDGRDLRRALETWQFWVIGGVATLVLAGSQAAQLLMLPRLKDAGLGDGLAVSAITVITVLGAAGRLWTGWLADRIDAALLGAVSFGLQALGLLAFALAPERFPVLVVFVLAFGLGVDNVRLLAMVIFARYYGVAALGRIQGVLFVVLQPGRVLGPVAAGALHDAGYGYGLAFSVFALITLTMCLPLCALRPPGQRPAALTATP